MFLFSGRVSLDLLIREAMSVDAKPVGPRLSQREVARIATETAVRAGFLLTDYEEPQADYTAEDKTWLVSFNGVIRRPGNYVAIFVNDETGVTRIFRGR